MFWGLVVQQNKRYSKTVSTPFHVSQAVLDVNNTPRDTEVQLILKSDNIDYILCILNKSERVQMPLNLIFSEGDEISFRSVGGTVHLTGYLVNEQNFSEYEEAESSEGDDPTPYVSKPKGKRQARQESGSENEESAESDNDIRFDGKEDVDEVAYDDSGNKVTKGNDDESGEHPPPPKMSKLNNVVEIGVSKKKEKFKDKKMNDKQKKHQKIVDAAEGTKNDSKPSSTGLTVEELREGKGPEVKIGRKVQVYYEGRFKSNNKVFDKANSGRGFEFVVGHGNVIRGWDVGVLGMRAGGKRRLTCPPNMAYGKKGSPPAIPPNATLVFDIEIFVVEALVLLTPVLFID